MAGRDRSINTYVNIQWKEITENGLEEKRIEEGSKPDFLEDSGVTVNLSNKKLVPNGPKNVKYRIDLVKKDNKYYLVASYRGGAVGVEVSNGGEIEVEDKNKEIELQVWREIKLEALINVGGLDKNNYTNIGDFNVNEVSANDIRAGEVEIKGKKFYLKKIGASGMREAYIVIGKDGVGFLVVKRAHGNEGDVEIRYVNADELENIPKSMLRKILENEIKEVGNEMKKSVKNYLEHISLFTMYVVPFNKDNIEGFLNEIGNSVGSVLTEQEDFLNKLPQHLKRMPYLYFKGGDGEYSVLFAPYWVSRQVEELLKEKGTRYGKTVPVYVAGEKKIVLAFPEEVNGDITVHGSGFYSQALEIYNRLRGEVNA